MRSKLLGISLLTVILTISTAAPALAWCGGNISKYAKTCEALLSKPRPGLSYRDVHYKDTLQWAKDKGFGKTKVTVKGKSKTQAQLIAESCQNVDSLGTLFFDKTWHLGTEYQRGTTWATAKNLNDVRIQHAKDCMASAKDAISKVPGLDAEAANAQRIQALTYLGNGLHALQDYYAHMIAGYYDTSTADKSFWEACHHGEIGHKTDVWKGTKKYKQVPKECLYDSTSADLVLDEFGEPYWEITSYDKNSRWLVTKQATYDYLDEFLQYGYGPSK